MQRRVFLVGRWACCEGKITHSSQDCCWENSSWFETNTQHTWGHPWYACTWSCCCRYPSKGAWARNVCETLCYTHWYLLSHLYSVCFLSPECVLKVLPKKESCKDSLIACMDFMMFRGAICWGGGGMRFDARMFGFAGEVCFSRKSASMVQGGAVWSQHPKARSWTFPISSWASITGIKCHCALCINLVPSSVFKGYVQGARAPSSSLLVAFSLSSLGLDACLSRDMVKHFEANPHKLVAAWVGMLFTFLIGECLCAISVFSNVHTPGPYHHA